MTRPARGEKSVKTTITANNQFTDPLLVNQGERVSISITGAGVWTVSVQRYFDSDIGWATVKDYTSGAQETYVADEHCRLRVGTTAWTSGNPIVRLGKG